MSNNNIIIYWTRTERPQDTHQIKYKKNNTKSLNNHWKAKKKKTKTAKTDDQ